MSKKAKKKKMKARKALEKAMKGKDAPALNKAIDKAVDAGVRQDLLDAAKEKLQRLKKRKKGDKKGASALQLSVRPSPNTQLKPALSESSTRLAETSLPDAQISYLHWLSQTLPLAGLQRVVARAGFYS